MKTSSEIHIPTLLRDLYYNPRSVAAFSSVEKVYSEARRIVPEITRKQVSDYITTQFPYTLHRRRVFKFKRNPVLASGPEELIQADLIDMQSLSKDNNGYKYILTLIDVFTKKAFAYPLKSKAASEVVKSLTHMFTHHFVPSHFNTDAGTEFTNKPVQDLLKEHHINYYIARNEVIKCAVIERFQRTLQSKLYKYFTGTSNNRYIDVLDQFVDGYNNTVHRSIGMTPNSVTATNAKHVFQKLYGAKNMREFVKRNKKQPFLSIGDVVRVARRKQTFRKGYVPTFSDELYLVTGISSRGQRPLYTLYTQSTGRPLRGRYYREELCRVAPSVKEYYRPQPDFIKTYTGRQRQA